MADRVRPTPRPGAGAAPQAAPTERAGHASGTGTAEQQHDERPGAGAMRSGTGTAEGAGQQQLGMAVPYTPGLLAPADLWQLATWAVSPAYDDAEVSERRTGVRAILLKLVDEIAPE